MAWGILTEVNVAMQNPFFYHTRVTCKEALMGNASLAPIGRSVRRRIAIGI